jgi:hypothetical protein
LTIEYVVGSLGIEHVSVFDVDSAALTWQTCPQTRMLFKLVSPLMRFEESPGWDTVRVQPPAKEQEIGLTEVTTEGFARVAEVAAQCWRLEVVLLKYKRGLTGVAVVRGTPRLKVAVAEVSELIITVSASISLNLNLGV